MRVEPYGNRDSEFIVIGEAPGAEEARQGKPFVGPSGNMVRSTLRKLGVDPDTVYYTNVVKEYKHGNPTPTTEEVKAALPELRDELASLPGKYILCVGATAKLAVTGSKEGITKVQGQLLTARKDLIKAVNGRSIMAVMHPAYILRNNSPANNALFLSVMGAYVSQAKGASEEVVVPFSWVGMRLENVTRGAIDIEATPYPWWHEDHKLISAAISFDGKVAHTIDLTTPYGIEHLRKLSKLPIKWIMHNGKYDRQALLAIGIDFPLVFDTMTAQYLIDPDQKKGLEFLAGIYLGLPPYKDVNYKKILEEDMEKILTMNGKDAIRTFRLYQEVLKPKVVESERINRLFQFLMMPAVNALLELELGGIPIDTDRLSDLTQLYQERYDTQLEDLRRESRIPTFNPKSPKQVQDLFFNQLKLPIVSTTPTGAPSFDDNARLALMPLHPLVELFHRFKTTYTRLSTFLNPWADLQRDGKLHTSYKPSHVVTGRLSSEKPNFQQVPREAEFRRIFGGVPGWKIVEFDYSQIELRMAAWIAGEPTMLQAYDNNQDLHTLTAELILGDPKGRQIGKTLNFGLLYCAGPPKLREIAFNEYGVTLSIDQAERFHAQFFDTYPALRNWHSATKTIARRQKYIDSPIGRRRYFQHIDGYDRIRASHDERAALNHPVQSMASDLMLYSLTLIHKALNPDKARVIATIHDSVLLLVRDDAVDETIAKVVNLMESQVVEDFRTKFGVTITVPLKVDYTVATHWKD